MRSVLVWDLPVRVVHWALVALVAVALVTGEDEGLVYAVHVLAGYGVGALLAFRLGWGVVGSRHARFADFVYGWATVRAYAGRLLRLAPPRYVGHNPLGGWMVVAMLAVLAGAVASGLRLQAGGGEDLHEALGDLVIALVAVHVAGVVTDSLLTGENLTRTMLDGRKRLAEAAAAAEPPPAPAWRALALAAVVVVAGAALLPRGALLAPPAGEAGEAREDEANDD